MNGAQAVVRAAVAAGLDLCLANPGTTEMPLVEALDAVPGLRPVLGLFEGVCTGAADGYARMTGRPALTLLHLGPGLANGLANLHNARRAHSPVLNLVGDHASWHRAYDAPLSSDIESLARPVSGWVHSVRSAGEAAGDFGRALAAALGPPGRVATLVLPADCQWGKAGHSPAPAVVGRARPIAAERVEALARQLSERRAAALLLGGGALCAQGLRAAQRIQAASGAELFCETFPARLERGRGLPALRRLPYFPEQALEALAPLRILVLAGARDPVAFFGYPGGPSRLAGEDTQVLTVAEDGEDAAAALEALADALGAPPAAPTPEEELPDAPRGALDPASLAAVLVRAQPEGAIVVDEGATSSGAWWNLADRAAPHSVLTLTGGAIGQGLPCATGAALACPGRKVIALQADGSGLYTAQSLWTQAREGLDVVTLVCANRRYRILQIELARAGIAEPGPAARALTDLSHPSVDWVGLAQSFGVPGRRAESAETLAGELATALSEPGPRLIEAVL